ncbi:MAG: 16S rRNA (uracil(1498)-N(3))-methyltransferase [Candidatus Marinimicrobia bacterium]|nr:16S rRNA (uracil(1498)-N(3))-methyltransferase [Candidatus Neomarinimicrobiota bacterium]|tara:strand:+ start:7977 stop:8690 length:714 start_codon:yes stop_codon:yes gene_type:complete
MEFFYSDDIYNDIIKLNTYESKHCIRVLRKKEGQSLNVVDGKGTLYQGKLVSITKKNCHVRIDKIFENYSCRDYYIHIAISPVKNHDRIEWFVEKSIEIGVDEISFIKCERTHRKKIKLERLHRTALSAMKQTLKAKIPIINDIIDFDDFVNINNKSNMYICHLENEYRKDLFHYRKEISDNYKNCILIGPEGDFTSNEIKLSKKMNYHPITLGTSRLRTETAGIVSCSILNFLNTL